MANEKHTAQSYFEHQTKEARENMGKEAKYVPPAKYDAEHTANLAVPRDKNALRDVVLMK